MTQQNINLKFRNGLSTLLAAQDHDNNDGLYESEEGINTKLIGGNEGKDEKSSPFQGK